MGRDTLRKVRNTFREVRDGSGHPPRGSRRVCTPSMRSGIGRDTLPEVRDISGHPPGGPGRVGTPSGRSETLSGRFETGWDTLREV